MENDGPLSLFTSDTFKLPTCVDIAKGTKRPFGDCAIWELLNITTDVVVSISAVIGESKGGIHNLRLFLEYSYTCTRSARPPLVSG
jgi:hypothetical protein